MDINVDLIIKVIIPILGAILTYILVPFVKNTIIPWFETKTESAYIDNVYVIVKLGVKAAEQQLKEWDPTGERRKQYVLNYLEKKKVDITLEDLNNMLEAAVLELNIEKGKYK